MGYSPWSHKRVGHNLAIKHQQQADKEIGVNIPHSTKDRGMALELFSHCVLLQNIFLFLAHLAQISCLDLSVLEGGNMMIFHVPRC